VDAEGGHRPRHFGELHQGRNWSSAAIRRSTRRTSAGWNCTKPVDTFVLQGLAVSAHVWPPIRASAQWHQLVLESLRDPVVDPEARKDYILEDVAFQESIEKLRVKGFPLAAYKKGTQDGDRTALEWQNKYHIIQEWLDSLDSYLFETDELPAPHPHLQSRATQLPRLAGTARGVRHRLPLRTDRRAIRPDPSARLHPDDAHLFITPEQIESELRSNIELVLFVLQTMGLTDYRVRIGMRDPASDNTSAILRTGRGRKTRSSRS